LKFEFFIANKIAQHQKLSKNNKGTKPILDIATIGIALGITVMIVSISIVLGFQTEIKSKVIGFGSHIQIASFESKNAIETSPVDINQHFYPHLDTVSGIRHIQIYATKAGLMKKKEMIHGVILKGVSADFDWSFFNQNLIEGNSFKLTNETTNDSIIISKSISQKTNLVVGDSIVVYFIQEPPRARKFFISGIYETGMSKFDDAIVIADIKHIQKLNNWDKNQISGFEVIIDEFNQLDKLDEFVYDYIGMELNATTIAEKHQDIFGWLELQDWNVIIILSLMTLVAGINMISALLILILDKINMIGILKSIGATNESIRKIFLINGSFLIGKGLLIGNFIGLSICYLQYKFHLISLPKETYYVAYIPIEFNLNYIALLNIITFIVCIAMLILPSMVISKISPVKAVRFN
jgi:lipoprotein-releasing system permease protein